MKNIYKTRTKNKNFNIIVIKVLWALKKHGKKHKICHTRAISYLSLAFKYKTPRFEDGSSTAFFVWTITLRFWASAIPRTPTSDAEVVQCTVVLLFIRKDEPFGGLNFTWYWGNQKIGRSSTFNSPSAIQNI